MLKVRWEVLCKGADGDKWYAYVTAETAQEAKRIVAEKNPDMMIIGASRPSFDC